jgi:hypothetical protein
VADSLNWTSASAAIAAWVRSGSGLDQDHVFWAYEGRRRPTAPYISMSVQQVRGIGHDWLVSADNPLTFADLTVTSVDPTANTLAVVHPFSNGDGPVHIASTLTLPAPLVAGTDYWVIVVDASTIQLAASYVRTGGQQPLGAGNPVTPIDLTTVGSGTITIAHTPDTVPAGKEIVRHAQGIREVTVHLECIAQDGGGYDAVRIMTNVVAALQLNLYALDQAGVGVSDVGSAFSQGGVQHLEGHRGGILEPRAMWDLTFYMASDFVGFDTIIESVSGQIDLETDGGALPPIPFSAPE